MSRLTRYIFTGAVAGLIVAGRQVLRASRRISFKGKVVLITGGARGLGLLLARELAQEGALLAICSRSAEQLASAKAELEGLGAQVLTFEADVADQHQVEQMIASVRQTWGRIDVLINNAGVIQAGPYNAMTREDFEQSLNVHFWGAYNTISCVVPHMRERRSGRIVNIASIGGKVSVPHLLPYCTGKFALVGYSEGLRPELAQEGILVTTICPNLMQTGSHVAAQVKGDHLKEYSLFKTIDGLPGVSTDATAAARQMIEAIRYGEAEVIVGFPAQALALLHGMAPSVLQEGLSLVSRALPKNVPGGMQSKRGSELEGQDKTPRPIANHLAEVAERNNEV